MTLRNKIFSHKFIFTFILCIINIKFMYNMYNLGLYIFRRDLRIQNNNALHHALKECKQIIPIFIFTPEQVTNNSFKSNKSVQFMVESLADLNENIKSKDGELHTMYGDYKEIIEYLMK